MPGLSGRVAVLTGATGGLGRVLSEALVADGVRVALLDQDPQALEHREAVLGRSVARGWAVDVSSLAQLEQAFAEVHTHFGRIDIVVAGAGIARPGLLASGSVADFEKVIDVNLLGVYRTLRVAMPYLEQTRGYALGVSSMAAFVHPPAGASYAASKAGVWAMCNSLRTEVAHKGIAVGSVHPTFFRTPLVEAAMDNEAVLLLMGGPGVAERQLIPIGTVVEEVMTGIRRREPVIVIPRRLRAVAWLPVAFNALARRFLSESDNLRRASSILEAEQP
ncbi:MAG: SDR family NAD(P)-dependent oxidoreductase [Actinobacteria bacterium]|nr:SDR family NAD(P)-dependent oxidoreductase [Actinomycetota bacterium]